jgi:hypothetical protein
MVTTVKGGLFAQYGATHSLSQNVSPLRRPIAMLLGRRGMMKLRELLITLNGAAAGSAALKQIKRVAASSELGGVRTIENEDIVNRVSAAGDVTEINTDLTDFTALTHDPSPVANLDGNPLGTR